MWLVAITRGMAAGLAGAVAMSVTEKIEQAYTRRPDSHVPARTLERLLGLPERPGKQPYGWNLAMHFGQGTLMGGVRGLQAAAGLRGPWASSMFLVVRLTSDQILENATAVGAPPWTWPRRELVVDLLHKSVYAFVTGIVADRLVGRLTPGPGRVHAMMRPGRRSGVGPPPRPSGAG
ncbi:hypothetical protein [Allosalinactinospora lopnorensis]|uniref:hypothetical protein n=1 Tax=Allosalinactinospora lopnorensis TaxID=1352348 RepID=UPI000623BF41|nr:hypothetical protein [Allosalinactinospora lopnorensis]